MESENLSKTEDYWVSSMANLSNFMKRSNSGGIPNLQSRLETTAPYEERFRVDRGKMEQLIIGAHECADSAETFFNSVMSETNTGITWPCRLKMGAKSRKDPYVRISGHMSDVKRAKEMVKSILDTRGKHAILKIDISYTDHSHIIGKGGQTIQRVMELTCCHIHFPDSNRNNPLEKSNQVSISGKIEWVERARQQLRMLTPLVFSFELTMKNPVHTPINEKYPIVQMVQEQYNVMVTFRKCSKLFSYNVVVKGSESTLAQVEKATGVLIRHLCDIPENEAIVKMTMEITPNHHLAIRGYGNYNLKLIMKQTSTTIIFPDTTDPNLPLLKKSTVTICGKIHNVYLARQRLVGSLPMMLMFDVEEEYFLNPNRLNELMEQYEVEISMRLKPKYRLYSVCIKGVERYAGNVYEARKRILNSSEPSLIPCIPSTYFPVDEASQTSVVGDEKAAVSSPPSSLNLSAQSVSSSPASAESSFSNEKADTTNVVVPYHSMELSSGISSLTHQSGSTASPPRSPRSFTRFSMGGVDSGFGDTSDVDSVRPSSTCAAADSDQEISKIQDEPFYYMYSEYDSFKHLAMKARQAQPDASKCRIPNLQWSGYGFSYSMPESALKINLPLTDSAEGVCDKSQSLFQYDDKFDCIPEHSPSASMDLMVGSRRLKGDIPNVTTLLDILGLDKYAYLFTSQEIDMTTFMTLNDNDLKQLGIATFGARRKILLAINELKKDKSHFRGEAAPGAERKTSNSSYWNNFMQ